MYEIEKCHRKDCRDTKMEGYGVLHSPYRPSQPVHLSLTSLPVSHREDSHDAMVEEYGVFTRLTAHHTHYIFVDFAAGQSPGRLP